MWLPLVLANTQIKNLKKPKFGGISKSSEVDASSLASSVSNLTLNTEDHTSNHCDKNSLEFHRSERSRDYIRKLNNQKNALKRDKKGVERKISDVVGDLQHLRSIYGNSNNKKISKKVRELDYLKKLSIHAHGGSGTPDLLRKLQSFIEYLKSVREVVGEKTLSFVVDVFMTLYNIYNNMSWTSISLNISTLFMRHFPREYADYALTYFCAMFDITIAQADSKMDLIKSFLLRIFDSADSLVNDALWTKIEEFFLKISTLYASLNNLVAVETIDFATVVEKYNEFKKFCPDAKDLISTAFTAAEFVFGHWDNVKSGDWKFFLFGKEEAKSFEMEVRLLENAFTFAISNHEVELKDKFGLTPKTFETRLEKALKRAEELARVCTSVNQKMAISNFIKSLSQKQTDWYARLSEAPSRPEPYGIKLAGPSSCGKSYISNMIAKIILHAHGEDTTRRGLVVLTNISEKFESTIQPSHKVIICDDVANSKNERPNYDRILNYVNTIPRPLEKADVAEKGKKFPGNVGLLVTTNVDDLNAQEHSNCAESILRRFELHVDIKIRPEFQNAFGGLAKQPTTRYDVYELVLKRFDHIDEGGTIVWDVIPRSEWVGDDSVDKDFASLCKFVARDVQRHKAAQYRQLNAQKDFDGAVFCHQCKVPEVLCLCEQKDKQEPIKDLQIDLSEDKDSNHKLVEECVTTIEAHAGFGFLSGLSTADLWNLRSALLGNIGGLKNLYKRTIMWQLLYANRRKLSTCIAILVLVPYISLLLGRGVGILSCIGSMWSIGYLYDKMLQDVERILQQRVDYLSSTFDNVRDHVRSNILKYFAFGASFYALYKAYKVFRPILVAEDKSTFFDGVCDHFGNSVNKPSKVHKIRADDERDYIEGYSRLPPKLTSTAACTTPENLRMLVQKSLRVVVVKTQGQVFTTVNGLMVAGNVIMIPSHAIPNTLFDIETSTNPGVPSAKTKEQNVTKNMVYILPNKDMALVHLPSAPASNSFLDFFPTTEPLFRTRQARLVWKSHDNEIFESVHAIRPYYDEKGIQRLDYVGWTENPGLLYGTKQQSVLLSIDKPFVGEMQFESFSGLCGAFYLDTSKALIYGFHVAGNRNGSHTGWMTSLTRGIIQQGLDQLMKDSHAMVTHSAGEIKVDTYGLNYTLENEKPLYTREDGLGKDAIVTYFGKVKKDGQDLASRARTPYVPTPFEGVVEEFGPNKHMPPTHPNDVAKAMKTLNKLHDPVQHYEHNILEKAVNDYKQQTLKCIRDNKDKLRDVLRIYSQDEALNGTQDGRLFGMPNDTSAGFPINKSKKHCLKRDPFDESLVQVPREFNDNYPIQQEIDRVIDAWTHGERSEAIFKASSKVNELLPKKKAMDKVRKFYGSPFANFVASRRVLAGIPEFMREFWRETECLVGVNPTSKQWGELHDHITEYSKTNMIAGDFSGFDTRMAAQITTCAARIMISWYEEMGLTDEELMLVKGALSDIVHPNILFEGDLYRFANGNPSGNLITVQLNSVCNSIMMRYVYYALNPKVRYNFSYNVKLATYGDDNAMGVRKNCGWFNHTACQREFERLAIGYTMAEKDAESVPYIGIEDISFLKRKFVYHEDLGAIAAPIELDSIYKKFYFIKKATETPLSPEEQFGAYTDSALREAYLHGQKFYTEFKSKIMTLVQKNPSLRGHVYDISYLDMRNAVRGSYDNAMVGPRKLFAEAFMAESMGVSQDDLKSVMLDSNK